MGWISHAHSYAVAPNCAGQLIPWPEGKSAAPEITQLHITDVSKLIDAICCASELFSAFDCFYLMDFIASI